MPFVPYSLGILQLDAPDHGEMHALVFAFGAKLDQRSIFQQLRHLPDVLDIVAAAYQRAAAVLAHRHDRGHRAERDLRAAGWAVGGFHACVAAVSDSRSCFNPTCRAKARPTPNELYGFITSANCSFDSGELLQQLGFFGLEFLAADDR